MYPPSAAAAIVALCDNSELAADLRRNALPTNYFSINFRPTMRLEGFVYESGSGALRLVLPRVDWSEIVGEVRRTTTSWSG